MNEEIVIEFTLNNICPLCEGTNRIPIYPFRARAGGAFHHYWLCKCGMVYLDAYATDQQFFYTTVHQSTVTARHGIRAQDRSNRAVGFMPDDWDIKSHLDVGCGTDLLMDLVEEKYDCPVKGEGVEFDSQYIHYHKHYDFITDVEKTYDLITCIHTLEHVPDPVPFLKEIARVANKHIIIEVPSFGHPDRKFDLPHTSLFTPWTLERAVRMAGIGIRKIEWLQIAEPTYSHAILFFMGEV